MKHEYHSSFAQSLPTDVSDDEWALVAPYLPLVSEAALQRRYALREVFNAVRWMARAGAPWRLLPTNFPPWATVYQQTRRWLAAGCFEALVHDLRLLVRLGAHRNGQPSAVIFERGSCSRRLRAARGRATADISGVRVPRPMRRSTVSACCSRLVVSPANEDERTQVGALAHEVQAVTGEHVELAWVDAGLHRPGGRRYRSGPRHPVGSRPPGGGQARLCLAAPPLGRRAQFRLAGPLPAAGARL